MAFSLGKVIGGDLQAMAAEVWQLVEGESFDRLHVWPRDRFAAGRARLSARADAESQAAEAALAAAAPAGALAHPPDARPAKRGQRVLDCVLVGPDEWWIGVHRVGVVRHALSRRAAAAGAAGKGRVAGLSEDGRRLALVAAADQIWRHGGRAGLCAGRSVPGAAAPRADT